MKWRKISNLQYDSLEKAMKILVMLEWLNVKAATEVANKVEDEMGNFCDKCREESPNCSCSDEEAIYNYDRLYDEWKDAQLERENGD